jgi:cyclic beta-1,2-glucan synthetase
LTGFFARRAEQREDLVAGPLRGELLGAEHLAERARALARGQRTTRSGRGVRRARLLARLNETHRILLSAQERLVAGSARGVDVGPAGEWLLDNFHVVQEHIQEVRESLPRGYYRELPELTTGPLTGYPRVYELAITLISHTEGRIDRRNVDLFIGAFQELSPLTIGELWAVPAMLRLGLIESVRRMALRTVQRLDEVEEADRWAARIQRANEAGQHELGSILRQFVNAPHSLTPIFVSRFLQQLRQAAGVFPPLVWLEQWIAEEGLSPEDAAARSTQRLALTQIMMANSITSLREIARGDWRRLVERQSALEKVLRTDPAGFYTQMTFATRDRYRHVVERIAKRTRHDEAEVASRAIDLARAAAATDGADPRRAHVGYYLVDRGLADLERVTEYHPPTGEFAYRWVLRHPNVVFVGGIVAGTMAALSLLLWLAGPDARGALTAILLFALIPANDIAVNVVNQLVTTFLPPRVLPKLDLSEKGVPPEYRTAVVIPTLFDSVDAVRDALENLEVQFLANHEAHLHFALLSDFTDAAAETREGDAAIIEAAVEGVRGLNARYAPRTDDAFYLFHRPRHWNPRQGKGIWMGWERKRGKLAEFNRFLRGGATDAFSVIVGNTEPLRQVRYVITLDSDTLLPPEAAPLLVGAIAHPLNRAAYDASQGRVVQGYGILQPRVGVSLPSAHRSRFAAIYSGHPGVDPYTTATSDVYQDLFGEGSFSGKGIYDVDAFEEATHGRFPENTLLSHDLIEGSYARAGLTTDIIVYDEYPTRYLTYTRRKHRWIRGDWQLLPWMMRRVPGHEGRQRNRLSMLSRWKLLDNLRRSVVEIAQLTLLVAGWTILPGSPLRWTGLAFGAIAAPWVVSLLLAIVRPPFDKSWRAYYAAVWQDALTSARQVGLAIAFLPHQAWVSADAILRTLYRLFLSRRSLLEWQTASQSERVVSGAWREVWRTMWPAVALAGAILAAVLALALRRSELLQTTVASLGGTSFDAVSRLWPLALSVLPLVALWGASPSIAHVLSAPAARSEGRLSPAAEQEAMRYARLHWHFFERFVTAETNWLAPDNFQEDPSPVVAMRTSPTNIGLQLLATVSAYDLGFIPAEDMTRRLELAFRSLERMRRFRGHFFNWYDLRDLSVLEPAYVSTVDSGNLAGHLIALRQACLAIRDDQYLKSNGAAASELSSRLEALANRAYDYAMEMDFRFLFDGTRKLFAIGFNPGAHALDESYYDLLASEARLASFVALAKKDVPVDHWFHLGRTLTHAAGETALVSWSGSMFEYLMPALVMRSFPYTVLDQSYHGALRRHIAYGEERGVPWGMSESAYNLRDRHLTYQYRAFGVPDLALKRGLGRELVIAPYASALGTIVDPQRAIANLGVLEKKGALGPYGFRDAIDYTRPEPRQRYAVVNTYMAHHIGMTYLALANAVLDRVWQRRFHADPMVRAAELLLHERVPRRLVMQESQPTSSDRALPEPEVERSAVREVDTPDTPEPRVALLGYLPYTIMVSHCGGGYSRYEDRAVTRWNADGTRDHTGQFCYLKDITSGRFWSASHQPTGVPADRYRALLATDRVTLDRLDGDIETRTEIAVVPQDAAEVRRVTVTNNGDDPREIELTSYGEIVLAPPDADRLHPAFSNLFVETEWHEWCTAITATRRPRSATEPPLWCVHVVDTGKERVGAVTCETDRARFLGRGRSTRDPIVLEGNGDLSGTTGAVLDPIFALRTRVHLMPGQSASVAFTTLVATTRARAFELADRYHDPHAAQRALDLAWTATQIELRELNVTPADAAVFQEVAGHLFYRNAAMSAPQDELQRSRGSQRLLWAHGISGDWPILLATIESADGLPTIRQLFAAHRYWRRRGMIVDLVILNAHPYTYPQELNDRITEAMFTASDSTLIDRSGGVFLRRRDALSDEELLMLRATARVHIPCDGRSLGRILAMIAPEESEVEEAEPYRPPPRPLERSTPPHVSVIRRFRALASSIAALNPSHARKAGVTLHGEGVATNAADQREFENGFGALNEHDDYEIRVEGDRVPPAPWANVIANPHGGFVVTERGGGFTWAENSQAFRLTPWSNDPVSDPAGEALFLRDEENGERWSATPAPVHVKLPYYIRHSAGASTFEHDHGGIASHLTLGLAADRALKISTLAVTNRDGRARRISVTAFVEWTLGVLREHTQHQVRTAFDPQRSTIFARNGFEPLFADWVAFLSLSEPVVGFTADRREFLGRNGTLADPDGLRNGTLAGTTGVAIDPCAALRCVFELAPGETRKLVVLLGAAASEDEALAAIDEHREWPAATSAVSRTVEQWRDRLSVITVRTPEPSFNAMVNRWTLYQALACRMWARSALYQSSGAYGFRDQLQDVMAFVYAEPGVAREHILRAAARQFVEGDVQHWWHPQSGRGVRTRFSDDLAWLPYVVDHYVRITGDRTILDERVPFLRLRALEPGEAEIFVIPEVAGEEGSVYDHCLRALRRASTTGVHALPLIGTGDWNDGMNRVGVEGRGESVWLAWFLIHTLRRFAEHAEERAEGATAVELQARAAAYATAVEASGWDGGWYRRAFFDDGTPLGSAANDECRIDSIAQSWSVISGAGGTARQDLAMRALEEHLVRDDARLIMLLTPPFDRTPNDPGYIKGYVPGVRENGAQYTHAALWAVLAKAIHGDGDRAFALFQMLNPLTHAATAEGVASYKVEPYVVAADVYTAAGQLGRGGWTWYTGSASWMYRVAVEAILGFTKRGDTLTIAPCVPTSWRDFTIEYRYGRTIYEITVRDPGTARRVGAALTLDGAPREDNTIRLVDDGKRHAVSVLPSHQAD